MEGAGVDDDEEDDGGEDTDEEVDVEFRAKGEVADARAHAEDPEDVEDIAPDDVPDGDVRFSLPCRDDGGCEFRERCADCDDSESDESLGNAEERCDAHSAVHGNFPADDEEEESCTHHPGGDGKSARFFFMSVFHTLHADDVPEENEEEADQCEAVRSTEFGNGVPINPLIIGHDEEGDGGEESEGDFLPYRRCLHGERGDDCGNSEDEENVRGAASNNVADRNVICSCKAAEDVHGEFWERGAKGDDGETDREFRHPQPPRDCACPIHKPIGAFDEEDKAGDEETEGKKHVFQCTALRSGSEFLQ